MKTGSNTNWSATASPTSSSTATAARNMPWRSELGAVGACCVIVWKRGICAPTTSPMSVGVRTAIPGSARLRQPRSREPLGSPNVLRRRRAMVGGHISRISGIRRSITAGCCCPRVISAGRPGGARSAYGTSSRTMRAGRLACPGAGSDRAERQQAWLRKGALITWCFCNCRSMRRCRPIRATGTRPALSGIASARSLKAPRRMIAWSSNPIPSRMGASVCAG